MINNKKKIYTKNGISVIIPQSTLDHMEAHPDVSFRKLREAVNQIDYQGGFYKGSINMGRVIGKTTCVKVGSDDNVRHFYRKNRQGTTPFVFDREPEDTTDITVIFREGKWGNPILITAWYGGLAPMEPWDARRKNLSEEEIKECDDFWNTHALIFDETCIDMEREENKIGG